MRVDPHPGARSEHSPGDAGRDDWISRVVSAVGTISVSNQVVSAGRHQAGETVDVRVLPELLEIWSGKELVKAVLRTSRGVVRKKKAETH